MNIFKDNALKYFEAGFNVIAAGSPKPEKGWDIYNSKAPYGQQWQLWCREKQTQPDVEILIELYSYATKIGLPLGPANNLVAFDYDYAYSPDSDNKMTREEFLRDEKSVRKIIMSLLPSTPVMKVGKKGFTYFYRYNPELINRSCTRNGVPLFDFLSDGKFTILPPSIHSKEKDDSFLNYRWIGDSLTDAFENIPPLDFSVIEDIIIMLSDRGGGEFNSSSRHGRLFKFASNLLKVSKDHDQIAAEMVAKDIELHNNDPKGLYLPTSESSRSKDPLANAKYWLKRIHRHANKGVVKGVAKEESTGGQEKFLADLILGKLPTLCKANDYFFEWEDTHWNRIDGGLFKDRLLKLSLNLYGENATIKKAKAVTDHVLAKIPMAPESNCFFTSSPYMFNFTDCTAEVIVKNNKLIINKRPHSKDDYLSYCAPFPLEAEHGLPLGNEFSKYLEVRKKDVGDDGIRIIKQMLGASLVPYVPRIFFIEGDSNSGKSTLAKLILKLLGQENVSSCLPTFKKGGGDRFNWEPSIGKIANIAVELPKGAELDVNTLKMVRDKTPITIDRKSQKHIKATLPFLHIYCCNNMPPSYEGNSGALNNRVSILSFGINKGTEEIDDIIEYDHLIWENDAGGVLDAAREGLADLLSSNFKYFNSSESVDRTQKWQKLTDSIQQYFEDINSGEWSGPDWQHCEFELGKLIYSDFVSFCISSTKSIIGKHRFYEELRNRFKCPHQDNGFGGFRVKVDSLCVKVRRI